VVLKLEEELKLLIYKNYLNSLKKKIENSQNFNSDPSNVADVQYIYLRFKKVLVSLCLKL
jgi:hypothetical protein